MGGCAWLGVIECNRFLEFCVSRPYKLKVQVSTRTTTRPETIWDWRKKAGSLGDRAYLFKYFPLRDGLCPQNAHKLMTKTQLEPTWLLHHRCVHQVSFQVNKPTTPAKTNYCARHEPCGARRPSMLLFFSRRVNDRSVDRTLLRREKTISIEGRRATQDSWRAQ